MTVQIPSIGGPYNVADERDYVSIKDFGVKGDGVTDDTTAFQIALSTGGQRLVPAGTYKLTSSLSLTDDTEVRMHPNAILDFSTAANGLTCLQGLGTEAASGTGFQALTVDAAVGGTVLNVSSAAGFAPGDYVKVGSHAIYDPGRTNSWIGELAIVLSTTSNTITLRIPLAGGPYNVADSGFVAKLTQRKNIRVEGGKILGGGTGSGHIGVTVDRGLHVRIINTRFENVENIAQQFIDCVDAQSWGTHVVSSNATQTGYAVAFSGSSQDCKAIGCYARDCRHATTTTNPSSRSGIVRRILVDGCTHWDSATSGDSFDTHAAAEDVCFRNCVSYDAGGIGFNVECARGSVIGCEVYRSASYGINFHNESSGPSDFVCIDNKVFNAANMAIRVTNGNVVGAGATIRSIKVNNNTIYAPADRGIYIVSADTWRFAGVTVNGNTIDSPATHGIQVQKADSITISGNLTKNLPANGFGLHLVDLTASAIAGNTGHTTSGTGTICVNVQSASHLAITGNVGTGANKGVAVDNASSSCTVALNDMVGCTTPIGQGTGAGHVVFANGGYPDNLLASSSVSTMDRRVVAGTMGAMTSGTVYGGAVVAKTAGTFTQIRFITGTTAPSGTYTDMRASVHDASGNVVQQTANLVATVTAATTVYTVALGSSVTVTPGQTVFLALGFIATTMPTIRGFSTASALEAVTPIASMSKTGWTTGTAIPNFSAPSGSPSVPWMELVP
jgi:hypothetical protein